MSILSGNVWEACHVGCGNKQKITGFCTLLKLKDELERKESMDILLRAKVLAFACN
jgi:hypothetical protein